MDRDNFMSAEEAQKFGLIDSIVENRGDAEKAKKK
ncbi:ATP-dependent Clp protease proteolytic subunit [Pseudoalteromonas distincta]